MASSLHGWQLNPTSLSPLACLVAWRVQTEPQRGPKGLQKGTPKSTKIDQKSTRAPLGIPGRVRGYPPGASEPPKMHIYVYLCMFLHIFAIFCEPVTWLTLAAMPQPFLFTFWTFFQKLLYSLADRSVASLSAIICSSCLLQALRAYLKVASAFLYNSKIGPNLGLPF